MSDVSVKPGKPSRRLKLGWKTRVVVLLAAWLGTYLFLESRPE